MKPILEQRKIIRNNDKVILGMFIGSIITIILFAIIFWNETLKFKEVAPTILSSITILIGLFTALKVLRWHEVKRNDKGFEVAQSIVMAQYSCLVVIKEMEQLVHDVMPHIDRKTFTVFKQNMVTEKLADYDTTFRNYHTIANTASASLKKWNVIKKENINDPLHRVINVYEALYFQLDSISKGMATLELLNEYSKRWNLESDELVKEMKIYNELTIDDIYEFNN